MKLGKELDALILAHIGDGIVAVDSACTVVFVNDKACRLIGKERQSMVGQPIASVMRLFNVGQPGQPRQRTEINPFSAVMATAEEFSCSQPIVLETSETSVLIDDNVSPIMGDGRPVGAVMVFRDASDATAMSAALSNAKDRYLNLFNHIKSGVAVYATSNGQDFYIADFNKTAQHIEHVKLADVLHKNVVDVFPGVVKLGLLDVMRRVHATGTPERLLCTMYKDAVRNGWRDNHVYRLNDGEVVAVYEDVTEKKATAEAVSNHIAKIRTLAAIVESSEDAIVAVNLDGVVTSWNTSANKLYGYHEDEVVGKSIGSIMPAEDFETCMGLLSKVAAGEHVKRYEVQRTTKDGTTIWAATVVSPIHDVAGKVVGGSFVSRDITTRKLAEDALAKSEARYRSVVEDQTETICRFLADGTLVFVNDVYCRVFGRQSSDLIGTGWFPAAVPEDVPMINECLRSLTPSNPVVVVENRVRAGDGTVRWMQFINRGFFSDDGKLLETQSVGRDITQMKELEAAKERYSSMVAERGEALSKANTILSVETNMVKMLLTDRGHKDMSGIIASIGNKLGLLDVCVATFDASGFVTKWSRRGGSSLHSQHHSSSLSAKQVEAIKAWLGNDSPYVGPSQDAPASIRQLDDFRNSNMAAFPVNGKRPSQAFGLAIFTVPMDKQWSSDEVEAYSGMATLLTILSMNQKNRDELSRRIEQTIGEMAQITESTGQLR